MALHQLKEGLCVLIVEALNHGSILRYVTLYVKRTRGGVLFGPLAIKGMAQTLQT